jgi:hypothetical protein
MNTELICKCQNVIEDDHVDYSNRCNEEGEDWVQLEYFCRHCLREDAFSEWGWCETKLEAIEKIQSYIDES